VDGVTLLAGYHTAYNLVGVLVLLPLIDQFTRFVETSALTRCLDPAALATPIAAVEAVRRTVAGALIALCRSIDHGLQAASRDEAVRSGKHAVSVPEAADAVSQADRCERATGVRGWSAAAHEYLARTGARVSPRRGGG